MSILVRFYRLFIIVALFFLIHLHAKKQATVTTRPLELADITGLFPAATSIEAPAGVHQSQAVRDERGTLLGSALRTSPASDEIKGYSGPSELLVALDPSGRVTGLSLIHSADTPQHVADVMQDENFLQAHYGLALGAPGRADVDAVSGSTLTSRALTRGLIARLGGDSTSQLFPTDILLAEIQLFHPEAHELRPHPSWPGVWEFVDDKGDLLGNALRTAPSQEDLHGYQGPTDTLILLDPAGETVTQLRFRKSYDNEEYYERILEDGDYLTLYTGKSLAEIAALDYAEAEIEGVAGATMTSWALAESVKRRLAQLHDDQHHVPPPHPFLHPRALTLCALTLGALLFSFTKLRGKPRARLLWQLTVIITLGLVLGDLLSQALFVGWARHGFPWEHSAGVLVLASAALLVPWVSGHQLYCHHLCPHGLLQHLFVKLPLPRLKIPKKVHHALGKLPFLILLLILASLFLGFSLNLANTEAFDAWLWRSAGLITILIALGGLLAALFVPLAYCKYGCPTGLLFRFLRCGSASLKFEKRDLAAGLILLAAATLHLI
ncbi:MAG: FMN-binding protein [Verrucomicrobiales bacterium]